MARQLSTDVIEKNIMPWLANAERWLHTAHQSPQLAATQQHSAHDHTQAHKHDHTLAHKSEKSLATNLIHKFGLQGSGDVIAFLKSTEGRALQTKIAGEIATKKHETEETVRAIAEHIKLRWIKLALLILGLAARRHKRLKLEDFIEEQIRAFLAKQHKDATATKDTEPARINALIDLLATYQETIVILTEQLHEQLDAVPHLRSKWILLEAQFAESATRYDRDKAALNRLLGDSIDIDKIRQTLADIKEKRAGSPEKITDGLGGDPIVEALSKLVAVHEGTHLMYTFAGQPTDKLSDAYFIVPQTKQIVVKDGVPYLLPADLKFDETLSTAILEQAKQDFTALHDDHNAMTPTRRLEYQRAQEVVAETKQGHEWLQHRDQQLEQIAMCHAQILHMQSLVACTQAALKAIDPKLPIPTPALAPAQTIAPTAPTPSARPAPTPSHGHQVLKSTVEQAHRRAHEHFLDLAMCGPVTARLIAACGMMGFPLALQQQLQPQISRPMSPATLQMIMQLRADAHLKPDALRMEPMQNAAVVPKLKIEEHSPTPKPRAT